ncbi:MAG: hypothetical protein H7A21_13780 [Spirochaetales bacterium]|nr:hypothetical protein [Leptospiraceae bacterium]MCP5482501.1 hypothetical protein [Spirochaetales bacterium]MCP5485795.1 hypothetical protein [Spirochaetales bacterium]
MKEIAKQSSGLFSVLVLVWAAFLFVSCHADPDSDADSGALFQPGQNPGITNEAPLSPPDPQTLIGLQPDFALSLLEDEPIWSGTSSGRQIEWTTTDLRVRAGETVMFSVREDYRREFEREWFPMAAENYSELHEVMPAATCTDARAATLLSLVGPYLSYQNFRAGFCFQAHPYETNEFQVLDLSGDRPRSVSLTEIFPEQAIFEALHADTIVQRSLRQIQAEPIRNLDELMATLERWNSEGPPESTCAYRFDPDMLEHFAFHHLDGDRVAVRIGLPYGCEVMRGTITQLGLYLPVPDNLRAALQAADSRSPGMLMQDISEISDGRAACLYVNYPPVMERENYYCAR